MIVDKVILITCIEDRDLCGKRFLSLFLNYFKIAEQEFKKYKQDYN